ncbi:hypothetical protein [Nitrolancea hollandica]|uniref:Uncharacterized protein n=1 Tax=Nitrolancea hollandica Lb TaxID=1129897 RepID=I4ED25_9BACT|nr:hypothetical protein [Nitrolancea hollandica]CCF82587.1 conserved hypothetical protein [Nitrolancea hollandica Lb]
MDSVEQVAAAVLYEGYVLWPYRRSVKKNQKRWTLGGVYPRAYSEAVNGSDAWLMRTECLVAGDAPVVDLKIRFLQIVERSVGWRYPNGSIKFVDELRIGDERYLAWEEATEREIVLSGLRLTDLETPRQVTIEIPAGSRQEVLADPSGDEAGILVRDWSVLAGAIEVRAEPLRPGLTKLTVEITNTTPWDGKDRESALKGTFASTHTILKVTDGEFMSLMDPPEELKVLAGECENIKTWPVLAGEEGDRHLMLSSPIILYDYPRIAPESPGDLFDGTEIDQLLILNILTLTDEEKAEMRATDPKAREILERSESLTTGDFMRLHGAIREFQVLDGAINPILEDLEKPVPLQVTLQGQEITPGTRVRLRPRAGGDILDIALAGKIAIVEGIEQDYEDKIHLAVTIEDDPGRDLGRERWPGHRFFFSPEEVEPLSGGIL